MSRIGKQKINIPDGIEVTRNNGSVAVKGPGGILEKNFRDEIKINIENNLITLVPKQMNVFSKALWGTYAAHLKNMIQGVSAPFSKKLKVEGIGFKSEVSGDKLKLMVGFSHPVEIGIPEDLKVSADKNLITISGIDKEKVGQFSARVRAVKKPEPYKGKGIRYEDEIIRRKQGKKAVT